MTRSRQRKLTAYGSVSKPPQDEFRIGGDLGKKSYPKRGERKAMDSSKEWSDKSVRSEASESSGSTKLTKSEEQQLKDFDFDPKFGP